MADAHIKAVDDTMDSLQKLCTSDDDWEYLNDKKDVKIHLRHVEDSAVVMLRGVTTIPKTPEEILKCTEDLESRKAWDELFIEGSVVKELDENHQVIHFKFKSPSMMVTNRDFVMARAVKRCDDGTILSNHVSVVDDDAPDAKGFVRGDVFASGYWLKPNGDGTSTAAYVVQIDPKGWIPTAIVNVVAKKQPLVLAKMREYLAKQ
uniref:START domain-containing protein n=1 Tax=Vannella robusta TaxID=1487602 RepID=A0A7S4MT69_9EUKA